MCEHLYLHFIVQKNEMEKGYLKLQEAHEGQQALLQKLQVWHGILFVSNVIALHTYTFINFSSSQKGFSVLIYKIL